MAMNRRQLSARMALRKAKQRQRFIIWLSGDFWPRPPGAAVAKWSAADFVTLKEATFKMICQVYAMPDFGPLEMNNTSSMYAQCGLVRIDDSPVVRKITK